MKIKSPVSFSKKRNKAVAMLLSAILLMSVPSYMINGAAVGTVISNTVDTQTVTSGVIHKTIKRFTTEGWLSINILQVDLTNPNIKLNALTNTSISTKMTTVKSIADSNSAVAAVNANYFYSVGNGNANALGPAVSNGEIVSASDGFNATADTMATFSLNSARLPAIDYWKTNITITSPTTGATQSVTNYNRMSSYYFKDIIILDNNYGKMSLGASTQYPDLVEMVVSNGVVTEIRNAQPAVTIPENGFVAVTRASDTNFILKNFQVGYPVAVDVKSSIDWKTIELAVSGSSVLLKDGVVPAAFSFSDPENVKRNPRTMIGSTKDAKTLFIVTVDGRQKASIGMTLAEGAQFMLELGTYNALNLDGGGSTTMVSRPLAEKDLSLVNVPSDSGMRGVTTALGILSTAPAAELAGLVIDSEDGNVFVNTSRKLTVRGYDKYFNPVEVNQDDIKWSVSGVKGTVVKGEGFASFTPKEVGEAKLTASIGNIKKAISISSLSSPVRLALDKTSIKVPAGTNSAIGVKGYNLNGYSAMINPVDVHFNVVGKESTGSKKAVKLGTVNSEGAFVPEESGVGYIDAYVGKVHAYCAVSVRFSAFPLMDDFESEINRTFSSYPEGTVGTYVYTKDVAYDGKASGKLIYAFADSQSTQAAYINYPDKGIAIKPGYDYIGVYVNIPVTNDAATNAGNQIKAEVIDGDGKSCLLTFSSKMDWTGWKYLQADISGIKNPAYLTRLYVARTTAGASLGEIYFDRLLLKKTWYNSIDSSSIPVNTVPKDTANVKGVSFKSSSTSLRFAVMGQSSEPSTDVKKALVKKMVTKINKSMETFAVVGNSAHAFTKDLKKQFVATHQGFKSYVVKNSLFIQLDMSKGSLRTSDAAQWSNLQTLLKNTKSQNVFIFLAESPDEMSDSMEAVLFKNTLTEFKKATKKNVWVFFNGSKDTSYMERGIKYISTCGYAVDGLSSKTINSAMYYQVTVKGNAVTYELKSMNK